MLQCLVKEIALAVLGIAFSVVAMAISIISCRWLDGIARNPEAEKFMFIPAVMCLAFTELFGLSAFVLLYLNL